MIFSSTKSRRQKLRETPFPEAWREILLWRFPLLACLSPEDHRELEGHMQVFLAEKQFEGCDGLVITDEIRVVIAAQACLLLLHRDTNYYPDLKSILVYPSTYFSRVTEEDEEQKAAYLGQSWQRGPVILAWDAVEGGVSDRSAGQNVVFPEFAHQLDEEDGQVDGAPVLAGKEPALERLSRYRS
jgi:MtfA peptidase